MVQGRRRVQIVEIDDNAVFPLATARAVVEDLSEPERAEALIVDLMELFKHASRYLESVPDSVFKYILALEDPGQLCDSLATIMLESPDQLQELLEQTDVVQRLKALAQVLSEDLRDNQLHEEVHIRLQDEIAANQREMYLREQMRVIQQELGDGDVFQQEMHELSEKINSANFPPDVQEKAMKELSRLGVVPPMSPESGVIHTYLDRLLTLPWKTVTEENLDLEHAEAILDEAHYGLRKVKARIIEHIAVRKLAQDKMKSPILCFVGPPGVGKNIVGQEHCRRAGLQILTYQLGWLA